MSYQPTAEQLAIIAAAKTGSHLVVNAYAGTGKTATLVEIAKALPRKKIRYVSYNASAREDAKTRFGINTRCTTSHGLATRPMGHLFNRTQVKGQSKYLPGHQRARMMGILGPQRLQGADKVLSPGQLASVVMQTIRKFCYTADEKITSRHVPSDLKRLDGPETLAALRHIVPPIAQRVWDNDLTSADGALPYDHDFYLKAYALTHPHIIADVILLDEAQDSNPCVAAMILEQIEYGAQVIMVGDTYQAIYGWRGAVDAMRDFAEHPGVQVLSLTQSFRFGPAIAAEGNDWLTFLGAPAQLRGFDQIQSRVGEIPLDHPDAILCRTNAEALNQAMKAIEAGLVVAFPKGCGELISMTKSAQAIKRGEPAEHPNLMAFVTWGQVQDFAENDPEGDDLQRFVDLVDEHGPEGLLDILGKIGNAEKLKKQGITPDVTVSTAHQAKGLEWPMVRIAPDFAEPEGKNGARPVVRRSEAMLAYVACTRAKNVLGNAALTWIKDYIDAPAPAQPAEATIPAPQVAAEPPAPVAALREPRPVFAAWYTPQSAAPTGAALALALVLEGSDG
jgi:superfamily I DNA/RNA helicase